MHIQNWTCKNTSRLYTSSGTEQEHTGETVIIIRQVGGGGIVTSPYYQIMKYFQRCNNTYCSSCAQYKPIFIFICICICICICVCVCICILRERVCVQLQCIVVDVNLPLSLLDKLIFSSAAINEREGE